MSMLNDFIKLELNSYSKVRILETIEKLEREGIESGELTFNVYSITLKPRSNESIISNDIVYEIPDEIVSLKEFKEAINRFEA